MNTTTDAVSASPRAAEDRRAASATAIEAIYRAQAARFRGLAAAVAGADAAGDVVQEAFARALRKRASWRGKDRLRPGSGDLCSMLLETPSAGAFAVSVSPLDCSGSSSGT